MVGMQIAESQCSCIPALSSQLGCQRHQQVQQCLPCARRVQRALEDHRNAVMLTEWDSRGDDDSPATPLRLTKRDWGDSLSSARIRATSGGMELVPLAEASGSGLARVSLLTLTLHAPSTDASEISLLVLHALHALLVSCIVGRAILMTDQDSACRIQLAGRSSLPRTHQHLCPSMVLRRSQVILTCLPCHASDHGSST